MPLSRAGVYTPVAGAETAFPGQVIASATWNTINTDYASSLTTIAQGTPQNVVAWGADPSGNTDSTTAFQNAINFVQSIANAGGGVVFVPPGTYYLKSGITITQNTALIGSGLNATFLVCEDQDVNVVSFALGSGSGLLANLAIYGQGVFKSNTVGNTKAALNVNGVGNTIRDVVVLGGYNNINVPGTDCFFDNVIPGGGAYGAALVYTTGSNWYQRVKADAVGGNGTAVTNSPPFPAWAASTPYTTGYVVVDAGYLIQCVNPGTSGSVLPTLKTYGNTITDGASVTWLLMAPSTFAAMYFDSGAGESSLTMVDMSGEFNPYSLVVNSSTANIKMDQCTLSNSFHLVSCRSFQATNNTIVGNTVIDAAYGGNLLLDSNFASSAWNITFGNGASNFAVTNNYLSTGTITIGTGSTNYALSNNIACTVTDNSKAGGSYLTPITNITDFQSQIAEGLLYLKATGVNFNSGSTDTAVPVSLPTGMTRFAMNIMTISNASHSLSTATIGLFGTTGGGSPTLIADSAITVTSSSDATNNNYQQFAGSATTSYVVANLAHTPNIYVRVGTPEGSAATGDVTIMIRPLP